LNAGIQNLGILMIGEIATTTLPQNPSTPRFDAYESKARKKKERPKGNKKAKQEKRDAALLTKVTKEVVQAVC